MEQVLQTVHDWLRAQGKKPIEVDPVRLVESYASTLGTNPAKPFTELGRGYSAVGFADDPPEVNPEAEVLVSTLEARGMPVIAITNTARREDNWQEFFRARTGLRFQHVVTSCEVGHAKPHAVIFNEAARRLDLAPGVIPHVGDRWELDGQGALDAGFGAVLYAGLWDSYPDDDFPRTGLDEIARAGVLCIRRLDDPRLLDMLA